MVVQLVGPPHVERETWVEARQHIDARLAFTSRAAREFWSEKLEERYRTVKRSRFVYADTIGCSRAILPQHRRHDQHFHRLFDPFLGSLQRTLEHELCSEVGEMHPQGMCFCVTKCCGLGDRACMVLAPDEEARSAYLNRLLPAGDSARLVFVLLSGVGNASSPPLSFVIRVVLDVTTDRDSGHRQFYLRLRGNPSLDNRNLPYAVAGACVNTWIDLVSSQPTKAYVWWAPGHEDTYNMWGPLSSIVAKARGRHRLTFELPAALQFAFSSSSSVECTTHPSRGSTPAAIPGELAGVSRTLAPEQRECLRYLFNSPDTVALLSGPGGTGKSLIARVLILARILTRRQRGHVVLTAARWRCVCSQTADLVKLATEVGMRLNPVCAKLYDATVHISDSAHLFLCAAPAPVLAGCHQVPDMELSILRLLSSCGTAGARPSGRALPALLLPLAAAGIEPGQEWLKVCEECHQEGVAGTRGTVFCSSCLRPVEESAGFSGDWAWRAWWPLQTHAANRNIGWAVADAVREPLRRLSTWCADTLRTMPSRGYRRDDAEELGGLFQRLAFALLRRLANGRWRRTIRGGRMLDSRTTHALVALRHAYTLDHPSQLTRCRVWISSATGFMTGSFWSTALTSVLSLLPASGSVFLGILDEAASVSCDSFLPGWLRLWSLASYAHVRFSVQLVLAGDTQQVLAGHANPGGRPPNIVDYLRYTQSAWARSFPSSLGIFREFAMLRTYRYQHWLQSHTISCGMYRGRLSLTPRPTDGGPVRQDWVSMFHMRAFDSRGTNTHRVGTSRVNLAEAFRVAVYVRLLVETHFVAPGDVAVIAMYKAQAEALQSMLPDGVEVGTVDSFQGRENLHVAVSSTTARSQDTGQALWSHTRSNGRANVALGRGIASTALFIDTGTLPNSVKAGGLLRLFVDDMRKVGAVWHGPVARAFDLARVRPTEEFLKHELADPKVQALDPPPPAFLASHDGPCSIRGTARAPAQRAPARVTALVVSGFDPRPSDEGFAIAYGAAKSSDPWMEFLSEPVGEGGDQKCEGLRVQLGAAARVGVVVATGVHKKKKGGTIRLVVVMWCEDTLTTLTAFRGNHHKHLTILPSVAGATQ